MSAQPPPGEPPRPPEPPTRPLRPREPLAQPGTAPVYVEPPLAAVPVEPPWWRDAWGGVVAGIVGLLVGGLIGYLVGHSNSEPSTTVAEGQHGNVTQQIVTHTTTAVHTQVVVHTHTVTATAEAKTPAPAGTEGSGGGGGGQAFAGNGEKSVGTIRVERQSTLTWTNDGEHFQITSGGNTPVNSGSHAGSTILEPGTYPSVEVSADGNWTIKITPK